MQTISEKLDERLKEEIFPPTPKNLYDPARYILGLGGKRIRPALCLMGAELFGGVSENVYCAAIAIELFHNFTLIHDDIMDAAPLRRGKPTIHQKYGTNTALLSGDVMLVKAYDILNRIIHPQKTEMMDIFSCAAREVCEGQQLDMDFEALLLDEMDVEDYLKMITLKTSVLLAASLKIGGLLSGGSQNDIQKLYEFGKNIGIAFQIQDDYLDAFGNPEKFGKQVGGDILANKKTFLLLKAFELGSASEKREIISLLDIPDAQRKIEGMLWVYRNRKIDQWARQLQAQYVEEAENELQQMNVPEERKTPLKELMNRLLNRES